MIPRLFLWWLVTGLASWAQATARFDEVVQAYARDQRFMGSVLVAKDGVVIFEQSAGWANAEWKVPHTVTTKFRLGSISKQFTATAILLLVDAGKLTLDDPLSRLLPSTPPAWGGATVRQLLSHSAGVPNYTAAPDYGTWKVLPESPARIVAHIADKPLDFTPGEKFRYSNTGYLLLGWIVEQVAGQSYEKFLEAHVFQPLGMNHSGYDSSTALIAERASGYSLGPDGILNAGYIDMHVPGGAGALYSTTSDLLRWTGGLFGGRLLHTKSFNLMTTPGQGNYGFGLFIGERYGHKAIYHGGGIEGFTSHVSYYPEDQVTIVVLANLDGPTAEYVARGLAAVQFGETPKLPQPHTAVSLPRATLEKYVGAYELSPALTLTIALEGERLTGLLTGQKAFAIFAEGETKFFLKVVDAEIEFFADAGGAITHLILRQNGSDNRATRRP